MNKLRGAKSLKRSVEALRKDGETVRDIASSMYLTTQQLNHLISGRRRPTLDQALAIQDELGIDVREWV